MMTPVQSNLLVRFKALLEGERNKLANLANATAVIHEHWNNHWTGFYLVEGNELILGPFQGPVACTRIAYSKGVCGTSWAQRQTLIVDNVHEFEGHIACSPHSNSEIVVPLFNNNEVVAVLDLDHTEFSAYSETDGRLLEEMMQILSEHTDL